MRCESVRHDARFYARHGGQTVLLARFVPNVSTFVPFIAGMGALWYRNVLLNNIVDAIVWFPRVRRGALPSRRSASASKEQLVTLVVLSRWERGDQAKVLLGRFEEDALWHAPSRGHPRLELFQALRPTLLARLESARGQRCREAASLRAELRDVCHDFRPARNPQG